MSALLQEREKFYATLADLAKPDAQRNFERARASLLDHDQPRDIVIFGSGVLGQLLLDSARRANIRVRAFADNCVDKCGTTIRGVPVKSPEATIAEFNESATFVIGVFNGGAPRDQLNSLGCNRIVSYLGFAWTFPSARKFIPRVLPPLEILNHIHELRETWALLADDKSRAEFTGQIAWRCTLEASYLPPHSDISGIYFDASIMSIAASDVIFDCGAFDGDSLGAVIASGREFRRYYAFEPDPANLSKLREYVASLGKSLQPKIVVMPFAVGSTDDTVPFEAGQGLASGRQLDGFDRVEAVRIDRVRSEVPSIIKMDIEGMELDAILGASETLASKQPILAIAAYHCCEHLWEIPMLIKRLAPTYDILLRRYAEECWETVFYAIPKSRNTWST